MCVCNKKPFLATCSTDRTIKIWNYIDNELVYTKKFEKSLRSISFHPNGL